jgi:hypothetical protein
VQITIPGKYSIGYSNGYSIGIQMGFGYSIVNSQVFRLGWAGLGWAGLGWAGLFTLSMMFPPHASFFIKDGPSK